MALSYDHLFRDIGEVIEAIDDLLDFADGTAAIDLVNMEDEISDQFIDETDLGDGALAARYDVLSGTSEMFIGFKDAVIGWITSLGSLAEERLRDYDTVLDEMNLTKDVTTEDLLEELYRKMVDDGEDVDQSTVTVGAATVIDGNGDGVVLNTKLLDGSSAPSSGWPVIPDYAQDLSNAAGAGRMPGENAAYTGTDSELGVVSETMTLTCIQDSETDGVDEGSEVFSWSGEEGDENYSWEAEGSGLGPSVTVANGAGIITDGEFEYFTSDDPDYWTIDNGTASTHILENTASEHRGSACLEYAGDGAQATIEIHQDVSDLTPLRRYFVGCWVKGTAGIVAGDLTIEMEGTGYTAGTTEKISMNSAALAAQVAWDEEYFFFTAPAEIPSDFKLVVKVENTLTNAKSVYVDGLALAPVEYHGGVGVAILAGNAKFIRGDRSTFTVANDAAGTFQEFFRKNFRVQLPSDGAAGESISDAWAE